LADAWCDNIAVLRQKDASLIPIRTIIGAEPKGSEPPNGFPRYVFLPEHGRIVVVSMVESARKVSNPVLEP